MVRAYCAVPFTEAFGDFAVDWKYLKTLFIAVAYTKLNKGNSGSLDIRYFISSKEMSAEEFGKLCRGHWGVESMY